MSRNELETLALAALSTSDKGFYKGEPVEGTASPTFHLQGFIHQIVAYVRIALDGSSCWLHNHPQVGLGTPSHPSISRPSVWGVKVFRKLSWSLCFLGVLWFASPLHAQTKADSDKAAEWYQLAMEAMESGEWNQAALGFDAAHRLDPDPRLLYNAARAYEKGGYLENARKRYKEFLIFKDAPEELRLKAVDQMVAIELKLRAAEETEKQRALPPASEPNAGPRAIAPPDETAPLAPRPEGTAPIRVITAFNERYHVTIRDADGNSYKCPSVSRKRHCAHYVAQGRGKVSVGGAVSGSKRVFVGDEGSTVNLRDAATGPLIGTIASWASFALGSGMIALAFDGADVNDAMLLATFGSLLATYGLIGGVAFTIVWASHDEMTTKIGADDLTEDEVGVSWHGIGLAPIQTGMAATTGVSF